MTEMKKRIYDESNGLWYELIGDYYIYTFLIKYTEKYKLELCRLQPLL